MTAKQKRFFNKPRTMAEVMNDLFKGDQWAANSFQNTELNAGNLETCEIPNPLGPNFNTIIGLRIPKNKDKAIAERSKEIANSFLKEWDESHFKTMKQALKRFFLLKGMQTRSGVRICYSYAEIENLLGLPYTSSSNYAGVWVTNDEIRSNDYPDFHYVGFALGSDNKAYAILWDKDENEIIIKL